MREIHRSVRLKHPLYCGQSGLISPGLTQCLGDRRITVDRLVSASDAVAKDGPSRFIGPSMATK